MEKENVDLSILYLAIEVLFDKRDNYLVYLLSKMFVSQFKDGSLMKISDSKKS